MDESDPTEGDSSVAVAERDPVMDLPVIDGAGFQPHFHGDAHYCPWVEECQILEERNEELQRLHNLHDAVVNGIPSSIMIFDRGLRLIYANENFFEAWHRPRGDVGKALHELLPPETLKHERWGELIRQVIQTGEPFFQNSFRHRSPHRGDTVISVHIVQLAGKEDREVKALIIMDDVTEQESLQRQLVQSEKLAAMGLLSAGVAHEIRTPLSVIRLAAYDVKDLMNYQLPPDAVEQLSLIEKNVVQCNRVVENLLAFAREARHEPEFVEVGGVIDSCLSIATKEIFNKNIRVATHLSEVPPAWACEDDLKQILSNLILNAVQAMDEGGVLTIMTNPIEGGVQVRVSDTGHGIKAEDLDHIFDPFFTTKEPGQGTGLGLSMCRKILDRMNRTIDVQTEVGKGTTFTVIFPVEGSLQSQAPGASTNP